MFSSAFFILLASYMFVVLASWILVSALVLTMSCVGRMPSPNQHGTSNSHPVVVFSGRFSWRGHVRHAQLFIPMHVYSNVAAKSDREEFSHRNLSASLPSVRNIPWRKKYVL